MRVPMISDVYFPRINGVSTSIQTFREELHNAGVEMVLVAPSYPHGRTDDETGIVRVASRQVPASDNSMTSPPIGPSSCMSVELPKRRISAF